MYKTGLNANNKRNSCLFQYYQENAQDGYVARLSFPAGGGSRPSNAVGIESCEKILYGTIISRMRMADCSNQNKTGMVSSLFTYFNNGTDFSGVGISDNSEIDFEFLCAKPHEVHITVFTHYNDAGDKCSYMSRAVNMKTGIFSHNLYNDCKQYSNLEPSEQTPVSVAPIPDFEPHKKFYNYKIDWKPNRVIFSLFEDNQPEVVLWDYQYNSSRIPHIPAYILANLWHTNNWYPHGMSDCIQSPIYNVTSEYDFIQYIPYTPPENPPGDDSKKDNGLIYYISGGVVIIIGGLVLFLLLKNDQEKYNPSLMV